MSKLARLQENMRKSIQAREFISELATEIVSDKVSAADHLQIYQNNYQGTLVEALLEIFPIVSAFVGEVFTRSALKHFIDASAPREACLSRYGEDFAEFLSTYEHASGVPYLGDIAALEWAVHHLMHQDENDAAAHNIAVNENAVFIVSDYPLLNLWMVGSGQLMPEAVHIDQGGQTVCVLLDDAQIQLFSLSEDEQQLLAQIKDGAAISNQLGMENLKNKKILK